MSAAGENRLRQGLVMAGILDIAPLSADANTRADAEADTGSVTVARDPPPWERILEALDAELAMKLDGNDPDPKQGRRAR